MGKWEVLKPPCYLEAGPAHSLLYQFSTDLFKSLNQLVEFVTLTNQGHFPNDRNKTYCVGLRTIWSRS